jgi:hypothetical protein
MYWIPTVYDHHQVQQARRPDLLGLTIPQHLTDTQDGTKMKG